MVRGIMKDRPTLWPVVGESNRLTGRVLPLQVIQLRQRLHAAAQRRMGRHILDLLALIPQRRRPLAQPLQDLFAAPRAACG